MGGQTSHRADILSVSNANPCVVTTSAEHGYSTYDFVRLTDLNGAMPTKRGVDPLNNYKFRIIVTGVDSFKLQNPITFEYIDSTNFTPYVEGGYCNLVENEFQYEGD